METPNNNVKSLDQMIGEKALNLEHNKDVLHALTNQIELYSKNQNANEELVSRLVQLEGVLQELIDLTEKNQHQTVLRKEDVLSKLRGETRSTVVAVPKSGAVQEVKVNNRSMSNYISMFERLKAELEEEYPGEYAKIWNLSNKQKPGLN